VLHDDVWRREPPDRDADGEARLEIIRIGKAREHVAVRDDGDAVVLSTGRRAAHQHAVLTEGVFEEAATT
jgi:hypothetical protein